MKQLLLILSIFLCLSAAAQTAKPESATQVIDSTSKSGKITKMPEFPGGKKAMYKYLRKKLSRLSYNGKQYEEFIVRFMVSKTGKVQDVVILGSSNDDAYNKAVIRIIQEMPDWSPGQKDGKDADIYFAIPFHIALDDLYGKSRSRDKWRTLYP